jgi:translation elongation factor EF-1alpha
MESYQRAMVNEQTFESRREKLSQANKLSRAYAVLLDALNLHRGKGQQKRKSRSNTCMCILVVRPLWERLRDLRV